MIRRFVLACLLCLASVPAWSAVAFDAKMTGWTDINGQTSPLDITSGTSPASLTVGSGSNRALEVILWFGSGASFPAGVTVTWDKGGTNQAMTLITGTQVDNSGLTGFPSHWGLINPTSGQKTLEVTWTGGSSLEIHVIAISFTGVNQTSVAVAFPHGTAVTHTTATAGPTSVPVTSATGNLAIASSANNVAAFTATSGTQIALDPGTNNLTQSANYDNGAATVTLTGTFAGSSAWSAIGNDILAAAAAGATCAQFIALMGVGC